MNKEQYEKFELDTSKQLKEIEEKMSLTMAEYDNNILMNGTPDNMDDFLDQLNKLIQTLTTTKELVTAHKFYSEELCKIWKKLSELNNKEDSTEVADDNKTTTIIV